MGSKNGKYLQNGKLFGGAPENKKCLELNFTPENTSKTSKSDHHQILGHTWAGLTQIKPSRVPYANPRDSIQKQNLKWDLDTGAPKFKY